MASIVTITTATESVTCNSDGKAEHVFTVSNSSGSPLRIGAQVLVEGQAQEGWFTIQGEPERELAPSGTDQIAVRMQAPPGTAPGPYKFRLLVYSVKRPGEDFTEGPLVAVNVPAPAALPPKPVKTGGFPWWIVAVVAVVLIVGGVAGWFLWPESPEVHPESPKVHSEGFLDIKQTWNADFDEGELGSGRSADLWFQAETATRRHLTPRNGALIARVDKDEACKNASLDTSNIPVDSLSPNTYLCVQTNEGRYAKLRVLAKVGPSPGVLKIEYTTWEK